MPDLVPTRAQAIGVKPRVLAARTRRSLKSIREQLQRLALPWADIDNSVEFELDHQLMPAFDEFERKIEETIAWLEEPAPY